MHVRRLDRQNPSSPAKAVVLSIGVEPHLLETRNAIIQSAGYQVHTATRMNEALQQLRSIHPDIIVLGHALPWPERKRITEEVMLLRPRPRLIMLYYGSIEEAERADAVLNAAGDPEDLVRTIGYLLEPTRRVNRAG